MEFASRICNGGVTCTRPYAEGFQYSRSDTHLCPRLREAACACTGTGRVTTGFRGARTRAFPVGFGCYKCVYARDEMFYGTYGT